MNLQQEEQVARAMRDAIMEQDTTDTNWEACKGHYLRNVRTFERTLAILGLEIRPRIELKHEPEMKEPTKHENDRRA